MQLCKFMGVAPVEGFELGSKYEFYTTGVNAIRVCGNGMDKTFTVVDFNRSFARIPKSDTAKGPCKVVVPYESADMVNNPPHYKGPNGIDVIENFGLNFNTGNAVKYILRAGRKDAAKHKEDLQKAIWYLNRELSYLD